MTLNKFRQTYNSIVSENNFHRFLIVVLMIFLLISMVGWLSNQQSTVLVPPTLNEKAEISSKAASSSYKKSWAQYISGLLGNVTPGNAEFVFTSIQSILSPDVYNNVKNGMNAEVEMMKRDGVTVSFQPRQISYEQTTNKCFVTGRTSISASTGEISSFDRVYEVEVSIKFGQPLITYLDSYTGTPHTKEYVDRVKRNDMTTQTNKHTEELKTEMDVQRQVQEIPKNPDESIQ